MYDCLMGKRNFFSLLFVVAMFGVSGCCDQSKQYQGAVGMYERYHNGWYETTEIVVKGEDLCLRVNGLLHEMHPENKGLNHYKVFVNRDTLKIYIKKKRGKIDHLILKKKEESYTLNRVISTQKQRMFTRRELKEDFRQLQNILNRLHPSLHGPVSKHEFNRMCFEVHDAIDTSLGLEEFYKVIGPIVTSLGCGHTSIWMPRDYWKNMDRGLFPVELIFLKDGVCCKAAFDRYQTVPYGSRILSINGNPIEQIVANLKPYISADALSNGYRDFRLNKRFSYLYALFYGFQDDFEVKYSAPLRSETHCCKCDPVSIQKVRNNFQFSPILDLRYPHPEELAIMRISSFYYMDNDKFCTFIDRSFEELHQRGTKNLIIDIRGNDGGCPFCAAHLLSYLADESFTYFEKPYGKFADLAEPLSVQEKRFRGNLFILIDGGCFSTSGQFCSLLKYHKIGRLIGSETGGAHICNESKKIIELKHTRLRVEVARGSFETAVKGMTESHGIKPDDLIELTVESFQNGIDPVLDYAIKISKAGI
jgi:hypothetical protein